MENVNKKLDQIILDIKNSKEYKNCIEIKEKMNDNKEITDLVNRIKKIQKEYIRSNDEKLKEELDLLEKKLNDIPLYNVYISNLEKVNEKIDYIKERLNDYFYELLN